MGGLKELLQEKLHRRALQNYLEELAKQRDPYSHKLEGGIAVKAGPLGSRSYLIPYSEASEKLPGKKEEILIYALDPGFLDAAAAERIEKYFSDHDSCNWILPDEDIVDGNGICRFPYYKPGVSPEMLLSFFYPGGIFAVRREAAASVIALLWPGARALSGPAFIYAFCLEMALRDTHHALKEVLYHMCVTDPAGDGNMLLADPLFFGEEFDPVRNGYLTAHGIPVRMERSADGYSYPLYPIPEGRVSILILSKDHSDLLEGCVASIRERSTFRDMEILVRDNGSSAENRSRYEALSEKYDFRYFYDPCEFNFSALCNRTAEKAEGEWLLFLNDDTEVLTPDWIERMLGQAGCADGGIVGAKLYYPGEGRRIQHCGVANLSAGPLHRLMGWEDGVVYDRGKNRGVRKVTAVTGACFFISREDFFKLGGFCEELAIAYNDVELCMHMHTELNKDILIRNDVQLIHYESASRGEDLLDPEKRKRLSRERMRLYELRPGSYLSDGCERPEYSRDSERYEARYPYELAALEAEELKEPKRDRTGGPEENEALIVYTDRFGPEPEGGSLAEGADSASFAVIVIDLHVHVQGLDNADYEFGLFFKQGGMIRRIRAKRRYRQDVERVYTDQRHVELSGLTARVKIPMPAPPGESELWVEARSLISRQRLRRLVGRIRFDAIREI